MKTQIKTPIIILQLLIAITSISVLDAAVMVNRNGVTWEGTFEGDTVNITTAGTPPAGTTPAFSAFDANTNNRSLVGGSLQMVTTVAGQTQSFFNDFGMVQSSLMTAEWLASVDTAQAFDATTGFGGTIVVADGRYLSFNLFSDKVMVQNGGSFVAEFFLDTTQEITYRVTYDGSLALDKWNLYTNGNVTPLWSSGALLASGFALVPNRVIIGDYSSGAFYGATNWNFVSWTDEGAYAPVPEPTYTLALAVFGAMGLILRRKRASAI